MNKLIIGIGHKREVGKDLFASILHSALIIKYKNLKVEKYSFAQPIYDIAYSLYGWAGQRSKEYYDQNKQEKEKILPEIKKTPRKILIDIGMNFREIYPDTWLQAAVNRNADIVIIPDLRFPNEAELIQKMNGICVRIDRPGTPAIDDPKDPDNQLNDFTGWDFAYVNQGTKRELSYKADMLVEAIRPRIYQ